MKLRLPAAPGADKPQPKAKSKRQPARIFYLTGFILVIFAIMSLGLLPEQVSFSVGEIAGEDVYYNGASMSYSSAIRTDMAKNEAAAAVADVYVTDDEVRANLIDQISGYQQLLIQTANQLEEGGVESVEAMAAALPGEYSDEALYAMLELSRSEQMAAFGSFKGFLSERYQSGVTSGEVETVRQEVALALNASAISGDQESFFQNLLAGMELPYNEEYDALATRQLQDEAMERVTPVQVTVRSGEKLVSRGSSITAEQMEALEAVGMYTNHPVYTPYIGLLLLVAVLLILLFLYLRQYQRAIYARPSSLLLLAVVVSLVLVLCKLISLIQFSADAEVAMFIGYLLPVPAASLLLAVLLDRDTAIFSTLVLAAFVGVIMDGELNYALVALAGGLTGILTAARLSQRSQFVGASLRITVVNLAVIGAWGLIWSESYSMIAVGALFGLINGLLSAILAMGILPYLESAFGVTTVIRLLELSNSNHPLLKRLMMEAPGTYNHSILVGNLAEAAADAIGADTLLVRVASYYHDIGKLKRPHFYIENQRPGENPHDKLQPALSAKIITSHTVDGCRMLKDFRFPQEIIDIVEQHHGNGVLTYFYHKAKELAPDPEEIKENDYRYQARRPQTKEAALVMLADSVQAGVQALKNADVQSVEARVREIISGKSSADLLQECPLTFRDLEIIQQSFLMVLSGMNHSRISYPDQEDKIIVQALKEGGVDADLPDDAL